MDTRSVDSTLRKTGRPTREAVPVKRQLSKRLSSYAVAAAGAKRMSVQAVTAAQVVTAAGMVLATATLSEADIVTTHVNAGFAISTGSGQLHPVFVTSIDLNHDGIKDFRLTGSASRYFDAGAANLVFSGLAGAGALNRGAALARGTPIGPRGSFADKAVMVDGVGAFAGSYVDRIGGPWIGSVTARNRFGNVVGGRVSDAFLGLRFDIDGQAHFGWAELSVSASVFSNIVTIDGTLAEYAYDTVTNQQILAGQTSSATPEPATLGLLALGSLGLGFWRRKKQGSEVSSQEPEARR